MAISLKKLHQPLQMNSVKISRAIAFTTRKFSIESSKMYNTPGGTISHHFADTTRHEYENLLKRTPKFKELDLIQVDRLVHSLKTIGYTWQDIVHNPKVMLMPSYNIYSKKHLFEEFKFINPKLHDLMYCKAHMNSEISYLKFFGLLNEDTNVLQHLWENIKHLELPQTVLEEAEQRYPEIETTTLGELHIHFLKHYLSQRFSVEPDKVEGLLHKSINKKGRRAGPRAQLEFKALDRYPGICDTLLNNLQYDFTHVSIYPTLLNIYPKSVERLLEELPTIGGSSIYEIALEFPEILVIPVENILKWVTLLNKYNVTHFKVTKATLLLFETGNYRAVEERLFTMSLHPELKIISYSDKLFNILRQPYGVKRLVEVLSSGQPIKSVNTAIRMEPATGKRKLKTPSEVVNYVSQELDLKREEAKKIMVSYEMNFGLPNIYSILKLLKKYGFSREQMINGLQIISFEYSDVNKALIGFSENQEAQPFSEWMKNPYVIHLLMYLIKKNGLYS